MAVLWGQRHVKTKKWIMGIGMAGLLIGCLTWAADAYVRHNSHGRLYDDVAQIPAQPTGLVLGTSPVTRDGHANPYFTHRMQAAAALYHAGKVKDLVLSGDNRRDDYNEPEAMQQALMALDVPEAHLYLDFAGLRTLDSVLRMAHVFGQENFIIVSQAFHNERAVYLANQHGLNTYAYNAPKVAITAFAFRTFVREKLARVKVVMDVWLDKQPRHLGTPVRIQSSAAATPSSAASSKRDS